MGALKSRVPSEAEGCDAVLVIGFGAPSCAEEVRPYLDRVLRGRNVPRERYEEVVRHYERIGYRSPYNDLTINQAVALRDALAKSGIEVPVEVGMRNTPPYVEDALLSLAERGARRALGFIMAPHRSEASWDRYLAAVAQAQFNVSRAAVQVEYPAPWHTDPLFINAIASRIREALARLDPDDQLAAWLIFTAHSIPIAMKNAPKYAEQVVETARLVAAQLRISNWRVAFQSRSGDPSEPWLEPSIGAALREIGSGGVAVVVPIGFLVDHVEALYDLDIEAAEIARQAGVRMERAPTVGDHPMFIQMMAGIARSHLRK
ncbi:MAG TPA: ferrochelatase [Candidatus Binataceae bacterium]|nr:ferrochelatase [Candidatus Binataceae bacterium]